MLTLINVIPNLTIEGILIGSLSTRRKYGLHDGGDLCSEDEAGHEGRWCEWSEHIDNV